MDNNKPSALEALVLTGVIFVPMALLFTMAAVGTGYAATFVLSLAFQILAVVSVVVAISSFLIASLLSFVTNKMTKHQEDK